MNLGRTVFSQLIEHLPSKEFQKCVSRYRGDSYLKSFSCWDQFLAMAFAQLTYRASLRDIETCLRSMHGKLYHMGFRGRVARSTLADANESRDWRIYADFAQVLIGMARPLYAHDPIGVDLDQSSVRSRLDNNRPLPVAVSVGEIPQAKGRREDAHAAGSARQYSHVHPHYWRQSATTSTSSTRSARRPARSTSWIGAYVDFERLFVFTLCSSFFVVRTKKNILLQRRYSHPVDKSTGLRSDQTVILAAIESAQAYPDPLRRVSYFDARTNKLAEVSDQQLRAPGADHRPHLQVALAD